MRSDDWLLVLCGALCVALLFAPLGDTGGIWA